MHIACTRSQRRATQLSPQVATKSCSTDHTAIFKRLADENVEIVGHGI